MNKQIISCVFAFALSLGVVKAEYVYSSTLLDLGDTLGGVVQGSDGAWQNSPHGVAVAPDGNVWVNIYGGYGRMEILTSGDTVHYKGIYVLDPATGAHVSFSPIEILTFPDGTSDSLTAESANSGGGRGIEIDGDGNILSSHYKTLYKINYMTGEGMAMWEGAGTLTEAVADDNGNVFVSYVLAGELPCVVLDADLNYVGIAIDTVGHINRALEVTPDGEDLYIGSTWNGHGVTHWNSTVPGVLAHEFVDTFAVGYDIDACWDEIGSAMGSDSAYIGWCEGDTTFAETALWASSLDFSPDGDLLVGALTAGWGGPLGGVYWLFDMEDTDEPFAIVGNWHDWEGTGEGVTDGPRGAAWDADGDLYLADFYSNGVYLYTSDYSSVSDDPKSVIASEYVLKQNYPNPFNPNTKIEFKIPANEHVNVNVYNLEGRLVKTLINQNMMSGQHVVEWNGTNQFGAKVSSGMYIYQLKTNATVLNRTMTFIK
jgi:DNA-binding beta-propeller fold protein YncE